MSEEIQWPRCVVFDLDYTLWDLWIDTHITPPLRRQGQNLNELVDRRGSTLAFYHEVPAILQDLKDRGIHVAAASRTSAKELAREALGLMLMPGKTGAEPFKAVTLFNTLEIYPGSKLRHFREIHRKTKIPYEEMLFFDDESRNKEVEQLGVTMQLVTSGTDKALVQKGLKAWRKRYGRKGPGGV